MGRSTRNDVAGGGGRGRAEVVELAGAGVVAVINGSVLIYAVAGGRSPACGARSGASPEPDLAPSRSGFARFGRVPLRLPNLGRATRFGGHDAGSRQRDHAGVPAGKEAPPRSSRPRRRAHSARCSSARPLPTRHAHPPLRRVPAPSPVCTRPGDQQAGAPRKTSTACAQCACPTRYEQTRPDFNSRQRV